MTPGPNGRRSSFIIGSNACAMKLNNLKVSLAHRILRPNDEEWLRMVEDIQEERKPIQLVSRQRSELDKDLLAHEAGQGIVFTWPEVKVHARRTPNIHVCGATFLIEAWAICSRCPLFRSARG